MTRSIMLSGRSWRSAVDPPDHVSPADARRARSGTPATADELAAAFAAIITTAPDTQPSLPPDLGARSVELGHKPSLPPDLGARLLELGNKPSLPPDLGARLLELCHKARQNAAAVSLAIDDVELVCAIAARAPAAIAARAPAASAAGSPAELDAYLARCHPGDLALALAAGRGSAAAIGEIERAYRLTIDSTCRRFTSATHTVDDLKQILRTKLFVAEPGKAPKIADYAGQGYLENWLRVTAVRIFLDLAKRKDRTREVRAGDDDVLALPQPGDLALDIVKAEYREAVTAAMHEAAKQLEPGDRHLLRQHLVAGLSIDQLGAVLGIHRATAARRIARARERLVADTRSELARRLQLEPHELDEVIELVMSRLDVSIGKLLASSPAAP